MNKWEYCSYLIKNLEVFSNDNSIHMQNIDELGDNGFELVSVITYPENSSTVLFFKRLKTEEEE